MILALAFGGLLSGAGAPGGGSSLTCATALTASISEQVTIDIGRRIFIPASSLASPRASGHRVTLPDRFASVHQRRGGAARIGPDQIADQHEIGARACKFARLIARCRKADTGRLEQFGPPLKPFGNRLSRWPRSASIRLAEQHVVGARLARAHRIVAGDHPADTRDAVRL